VEVTIPEARQFASGLYAGGGELSEPRPPVRLKPKNRYRSGKTVSGLHGQGMRVGWTRRKHMYREAI